MSRFGALRPMQPSARSWLALIARTAMTAVVLTALVAFIGLDALVDAVRRVSLGAWLTAAVGLYPGHLVAAFKWRLFVRATGATIARREALRAHGAGLFANLCLPSIVGGDVIRAGMVARGRSLSALTVASVADRVVDVAALLVLAALGALWTPGVLPSGTELALEAIAAAIVGGIVAGVVALRLAPIDHLPKALRRPITGLREATDALNARPGVAALGFALSLAVQTSFVALNAMLGRALGIDVPFAVWMLCWPLAKLVALAPVSLGGFGVREAALAGLLGAFGVESAAAVGQSLLWQAAMIALGLVAGALAFGVGRGADQGEDGDEARERAGEVA